MSKQLSNWETLEQILADADIESLGKAYLWNQDQLKLLRTELEAANGRLRCMRKLLVVILLLLAGCGGKLEQVTVEIIHVEKTGGWKSCVGGLNYQTVVKTVDGRVDTTCQYIGKVGDKVTGYWRSGHMDPDVNGFRTTQ